MPHRQAQAAARRWFAAVRVFSGTCHYCIALLTDHQAPQAIFLVQKCVEVLLLQVPHAMA